MAGCLAGKRVLVLEDEYFIAADIRELLVQEDAIVIGPVGSAARGMAMADQPIDLAMIDVNLEGERSFDFADHLRGRSVPCMFVTGYDPETLPARFHNLPCVGKPFTGSEVVQMARQLVLAGTA